MASPHSAATLSASERTALGTLVERANAAARTARAPVLASFAAPLPNLDPLAALTALGADEPFRFYWEQPGAGMALAAGGIAQRFMASGAGRFRTAAEQVQAALQTAITGAAVDGLSQASAGPYVVGGFSFFDRVDAVHWPGFGAAQLVVPSWLTVRRGEESLALVSTAVHPETPPHAALGALTAELLRLRRAATQAPGENGHGRNYAFRIEAREDGRAQWLEIVRRARERIREGRLRKVVLARALDLVCEAAPSPTGLLRRLRAAYPDCTNFLIDPGAGQLFLGATPERMARFANGRVGLAAVAGTMPRGGTPEADEAYAARLLSSRKEREEHQIVVDAILAAVQGLGTVECPERPQVVKLSNLQHLATPITLQPGAPLSLLALLERLHPTPAVGGQPREEAFALIRECEHFERGWYGAPVGWLNARGDGEFAVALRAGKLAGERLQLFAGGGIMADSDPEREFEETQIKLQPLLSALASE